MLTAVVQAQERYRSNRNGYAQSFGDDGLKMQDAIDKLTKYYDISMAGGGEPAFVSGYSVTATAKNEGPQYNDKGCQVLQVELNTALLSYKSANANGDDTTGTANCWSK
ncbi:type IV pilin protein [Pelomonas sp. P8]|uniref:Type IV pilin protein n=1 Tax=Pelomonas cellulosilytica TaxID=2906762 RepID=A0ABS8XYI1_9BURK|nr:type IV pilin protein [Pelomonas sp. P8]